MRRLVRRALRALGFSSVLALLAACGGSKPEANAPVVTAADAPRDGSGSLDPPALPATPEAAKSEPIKTTAVSSTDDGSDIIPPFTANKDDGKKSSAPKPQKKRTTAPKPKKKTST